MIIFFFCALGESEANVRSLFMEAVKVAPCIVFIDEIDAIALRRDSSSTTRDRGNMVQQLLTCIDDLNHVVDAQTETQSHGHVVVIGATNRPEALDLALRRGGRFDHEISLGAYPHITPESILLQVLNIGKEFVV